MKLIFTVVIGIQFFPILLHSQGNLVANGGFEAIDGWTLSNGTSWPWGGKPGNGFCVNLSNERPSPASDPTATQLINSLTPSMTYMISGDFAEGKDYGGGSPASYSFGVFVDGIAYFQTIAPGNPDWEHFSFLYTAMNSSAILSLSSQSNGTGICYFIDNIAMYPVPEPSSLALLGLGGAALLAHSRSRRRGKS